MAMAHWHAYRWNEADAEFRRAISADSTAAAAHTQYGRYLLSVARIDDAIREFQTARRLDPLAPTSSVWLSHSLAYKGITPPRWKRAGARVSWIPRSGPTVQFSFSISSRRDSSVRHAQLSETTFLPYHSTE